MEIISKIIDSETNNYIIYTIVIIVVLVLFILSFKQNKSGLKYIRSSLDGNEYLCRSRNDAPRAANVLAEVNRRLKFLINHLKRKYNNKKLNLKMRKFKTESISESSGQNRSTSYLINKGESLVLCIRDKTDGHNILDINTVMFVALHEFAHLITTSIGHTKEFWSNFKFILKNAIEIKIYKEINYEKQNKRYCGIKITNSPLFTKSIKSAKW